ncbi:hypothetical protein [Streptosporangium sp. NPDC020145]|uniref:hypothetical protein n=1 Tax=Streptosporangium sp. NPDC020145 TaxID=3154694 RepID=UPI003447DDF7
MALTTPGSPVDITQVLPELGAYARTTVRLHPRPGTPGMHDSHIGGPLLWPADEPWPACSRPFRVWFNSGRTTGLRFDDFEERPPDTPVAMVAVAQFYARDLPEISFPQGKDLLQVLWCPNDHDQPDINGPAIELIWRRTADITDPRHEPPPRPHTTASTKHLNVHEWERAVEYYLPRPCVLHPERATEYPYFEELPERLQTALNAWDEEAGHPYQHLLSIAPGCKIGGWESWHLTDMYPLPCDVCGTETQPLLKLDSDEWDAGSGPRWRPLEERHLVWESIECQNTCDPTQLVLGRSGALTVFLCPNSTDHGYRMTIQ